jgi:hypothetical protein
MTTATAAAPADTLMTEAEARQALPRVRFEVEAKFRQLRAVEGAPFQIYDRRHSQTLNEAGGRPIIEQVNAWLRFSAWMDDFSRRGDLKGLRMAEDQRIAIGAQRPAQGFDATAFVLAIRQRGVAIDYNGTAIVVSPRTALNAVDEAMLKQHRNAVIAVLTDQVER